MERRPNLLGEEGNVTFIQITELIYLVCFIQCKSNLGLDSVTLQASVAHMRSVIASLTWSALFVGLFAIAQLMIIPPWKMSDGRCVFHLLVG